MLTFTGFTRPDSCPSAISALAGVPELCAATAKVACAAVVEVLTVSVIAPEKCGFTANAGTAVRQNSASSATITIRVRRAEIRNPLIDTTPYKIDLNKTNQPAYCGAAHPLPISAP